MLSVPASPVTPEIGRISPHENWILDSIKPRWCRSIRTKAFSSNKFSHQHFSHREAPATPFPESFQVDAIRTAQR
jgi:hypothetical protein